MVRARLFISVWILLGISEANTFKISSRLLEEVGQ